MFKGYTNVLSCGRPTWDIHGRPKNGRLWYQLKIWEKLKDLTLSGIEPGTPECHASVMHQCYTCSYQYETKGIFKLPY
jgi:hypothetical protein